MNETLTSAPPAPVSVSLPAAPAVATLMTNAVQDPAALKSLTAAETGLENATSFQDAAEQIAMAQSAANSNMVNSIAGEQFKIAMERPTVISADPAVSQAVTESTRVANENLWGRRQSVLDTVTSDTTGPQAAAAYEEIAKMKASTSPAAVTTSTRGNTETVFSGGTSLGEFIALPQKPFGPSSITALNSELAFLTGASSVAANTTSLAYRAVPAEAEVLYDSGKYKIETPRSVGLLKAVGLDRTDTFHSMTNGLADARFIDVVDLLAANSEKQTAVTRAGSAQILALNPPQPQVTFDSTRDVEAQLAAAPRKAPVMQMQPRGPVSYR